MAQNTVSGGSSGACVASPGLRYRDCQRVTAIVSALLATRRCPLPMWREQEWRAALRYLDTGPRPSGATLARAEIRNAVVRDPALRGLLAWAAVRRPLSYQLGAIAAALAALCEAHATGEADAEVLAGRIIAAVDQARVLRYCPVSDRAMLADCDAIADATPVGAGGRPSLVSMVLPDLLDRAGLCVSAQPFLARRVEAAVDVCLAVWLRNAQAGEGLPEFRRAEATNSRRRVAFLLGGDRDLQRLVEGPLPGRGRPLSVTRRRGLAYWVALAFCSAADGNPLPPVPPEVAGHWRNELCRVGANPATAFIGAPDQGLRFG